VSFTDELMADLDLAAVERTADVVGLTAMGPQIRRAYDLADHFRARGKRVVLGGTWVTLAAEESLRHADAVVAGEAARLWPRVGGRPRGGRIAGHLACCPLARPPRSADLRLLDPAAPQAGRLPLELALPDVLLLADLLLPRLSPSVRVLRDPDLLRPDVP